MAKYFLYIFIIFIFFTGCSQKAPSTPAKRLSSYENNKEFNNINISKALLTQYREWSGTKYKYGGQTKAGIDCSYLVQNTFVSKLNIKMPRTTYHQAKLGVEIQKYQLDTGDLVFFITSKKGGRHVGIYLDHGDFMHVSTSRGVMISNLNNPYWKSHYWKSKRVLLNN